MKKIFVVCLTVLCTILSCVSISTAANNTDYLSRSIFDYIFFDYSYLTGNDYETSYNYFMELKNNGVVAEKNYGAEIVGKNSDEKTNILYIQGNYEKIIEEMTSEQKEMLDKFLLEQSISYYYNILGADFEYSISQDKRLQKKTTRNSNEENVAIIRIYSDGSEKWREGSSGLAMDSGVHAFISVKNVSSSNLTVGAFTVEPNKAITIGTWSRSEHAGIWYNLEGYYDDYSETETATIVQLITASQLEDLNEVLTDSDNDTWSWFTNCSTFAALAWNSVGDVTVSAGIVNTPKDLKNNIMSPKNGIVYGVIYSTVPKDYDVYYGCTTLTESTQFN